MWQPFFNGIDNSTAFRGLIESVSLKGICANKISNQKYEYWVYKDIIEKPFVYKKYFKIFAAGILWLYFLLFESMTFIQW